MLWGIFFYMKNSNEFYTNNKNLSKKIIIFLKSHLKNINNINLLLGQFLIILIAILKHNNFKK